MVPQAADSREWEEEEGGEEHGLLAGDPSGDEEDGELSCVDPALDMHQPMLVLPLYSLLSPEQQAKVGREGGNW